MTTQLEWERQSGESEKAYEAFRSYRDMGASRSLEAVAQKLHKSKTILGRWSSKFHWVKRCEAYDRHIAGQVDGVIQNHLISEQEKLIQAEITDYLDQLAKYHEVWERTAVHSQQRSKRGKKSDDADGEIEVVTVKLSIDDWMKLTRWRSDISEFGRRALRMPKEISEQRHGFGEGQKPKRIVFEWTDDDDNGGHSDD